MFLVYAAFKFMVYFSEHSIFRIDKKKIGIQIVDHDCDYTDLFLARSPATVWR